MGLITDAQIDAAWLMADGDEFALAVLTQLGIERCPDPECRRGVIQHLETPLEPGDDYGWNQRCPTCHGHGWALEADDE